MNAGKGGWGGGQGDLSSFMPRQRYVVIEVLFEVYKRGKKKFRKRHHAINYTISSSNLVLFVIATVLILREYAVFNRLANKLFDSTRYNLQTGNSVRCVGKQKKSDETYFFLFIDLTDLIVDPQILFNLVKLFYPPPHLSLGETGGERSFKKRFLTKYESRATCI